MSWADWAAIGEGSSRRESFHRGEHGDAEEEWMNRFTKTGIDLVRLGRG